MNPAAAKRGDTIEATDTHLLPDSTPISLKFKGVIDSGLCDSVLIMDQPSATQDSGASNIPPHPGAFLRPPSNKGRIILGSQSVLIDDKPAARDGDMASTCNDPVDLPFGTVKASGSVCIG